MKANYHKFYVNGEWAEPDGRSHLDVINPSTEEAFASITMVTDHSDASLSTHDVNPVVAVTPSGNIGISWRRQQFDPDGNVNENVFIRILSREGLPSSDSINLTNNTKWGQRGAL